MNADEVKAARLARRVKGGALYGIGACHWCGFKLQPKALWCCGGCAQEYAAETRQINAGAAQSGGEGQASGL